MTRRAALITGGSGGIGLEIARLLGRDGYGVTISGRRAEKVGLAAAELGTAGIEVQGLGADAASEEDVVRLVAAHRKRFGRLDVLVNSAGVGAAGPMAEQPTRRLDLQLDVNVRGVFLTMRECIPLLREAGREHGKALIVNVASILGKHPLPNLAAYSATKAAVVALSDAAQGELAEDGIQVTALCPGWVDTPMTDWVQDAPREEMLTPADVAEAVRFLLRTSVACRVPEIQLSRAGGRL
jgi:NAD(P)-dependent dehydrogenase (short-subunit alcohol dehydrogenase family)